MSGEDWESGIKGGEMSLSFFSRERLMLDGVSLGHHY